jgi:hypothetical protein
MTTTPHCSSSAPGFDSASAHDAEAAFIASAAGCIGVAVVEVDGLIVEITAERDRADNLARYLGDYLPASRRTTGKAVYRVQLLNDGELFDRVALAIRGTSSRLVTPYRDVVYRAHKCGSITWFDVADGGREPLQDKYIVGWDGTRALIVTRPGFPWAERITLRVIREIMMRWHESCGAVMFHAAGVARGERGAMIVGPSGAGKTTSLLVATQDGGTLLSNDRMLVSRSSEGWTLIGLPLPVRIGKGTAQGMPRVSEFVRSTRLARHDLRTQDPSQLPSSFAARKKVELTPRELADALDGTIANSAPLRGIVLPELSQDDRPVWCARATFDEVLAALAASCFTPHDESWISPWLIERTESDEAIAERTQLECAELARVVPAVRVGFGVLGASSDRVHELRARLLDILENAASSPPSVLR